MATRKIALDTARKLHKAKVDELLEGSAMFAIGEWFDREDMPIFPGSGCRILAIGAEWATLLVDGERCLAWPDEHNALPVRFELPTVIEAR
jgi:hypothetical protein